jgi:hypothetical protein
MQLKLHMHDNFRSKFPSYLNSIEVLLRQATKSYENLHRIITSDVFSMGQTELPTSGNASEKKIAFLVVFRIINTAHLTITYAYITWQIKYSSICTSVCWVFHALSQLGILDFFKWWCWQTLARLFVQLPISLQWILLYKYGYIL